MQELVERYRALKAQRDDVDLQLSTLKEVIAQHVEKQGAWKDGLGGYARFQGGGETVSYDAKALDALCKSDRGLWTVLNPHRKVTQRRPYLAVK